MLFYFGVSIMFTMVIYSSVLLSYLHYNVLWNKSKYGFINLLNNHF